jgi:hypothetical protein
MTEHALQVEAPAGWRHAGTGANVVVHDDYVEGPIRWVWSPDDVLELVDTMECVDSIVASRGGTTSFVAPVLVTGTRGLITLQGAPESHLGILSREYGIPCVVGVTFEVGETNARGEIIPPDGTLVRLDLRAMPHGHVLVSG